MKLLERLPIRRTRRPHITFQDPVLRLQQASIQIEFLQRPEVYARRVFGTMPDTIEALAKVREERLTSEKTGKQTETSRIVAPTEVYVAPKQDGKDSTTEAAPRRDFPLEVNRVDAQVETSGMSFLESVLKPTEVPQTTEEESQTKLPIRQRISKFIKQTDCKNVARKAGVGLAVTGALAAYEYASNRYLGHTFHELKQPAPPIEITYPPGAPKQAAYEQLNLKLAANQYLAALNRSAWGFLKVDALEIALPAATIMGYYRRRHFKAKREKRLQAVDANP